MILTWLPGVLRSVGVKVVETDGWLSRSHGQLTDPAAVVWHHDASPPGDSPGALGWMLSNWDEASAQCWVDRYGTWHLVGCGVAWHAGSVLPGMPNNFTSLGIETDHTTGEDWPDALIESLRAGTAAILKYQRLDTSSLHFHKTICSPPGRKQDPDGLDLGSERATVGRLMMPPNPGPSTTSPPTPNTEPEYDVISPEDRTAIANETVALLLDTVVTGKDSTGEPVSSSLRKSIVLNTSLHRGMSRIGLRTKNLAQKAGLGRK